MSAGAGTDEVVETEKADAPLDGVFVLVERDESMNVTKLNLVANGNTRATEVTELLRLALAERERQLAG